MLFKELIILYFHVKRLKNHIIIIGRGMQTISNKMKKKYRYLLTGINPCYPQINKG